MPILKLDSGESAKTDRFLFALDDGARNLLLALSEQMNWRATWSHDIDDGLQSFIERLQHDLMRYEEMNEIVAELALLRQAVRDMNISANASVQCCGESAVAPPPGGEGGWEDAGDSPGMGDLPDGIGDNIGTRVDNACEYYRRALWAVRRLLALLEDIDAAVVSVWVLVSLLSIVFPEPVSTAIGSVSLVAIASALLAAALYTSAFATFAEEIVEEIDGETGANLISSATDALTFAYGMQSLMDGLYDAVVVRATTSGIPSLLASALVLPLKAAHTTQAMVYGLLEHLPEWQVPPVDWQETVCDGLSCSGDYRTEHFDTTTLDYVFYSGLLPDVISRVGRAPQEYITDGGIDYMAGRELGGGYERTGVRIGAPCAYADVINTGTSDVSFQVRWVASTWNGSALNENLPVVTVPAGGRFVGRLVPVNSYTPGQVIGVSVGGVAIGPVAAVGEF